MIAPKPDRRWLRPLWGVASGSVLLALLALLSTSVPATAGGIIPPAVPPASFTPPPAMQAACYGGGSAAACDSATLPAINEARAAEGVGPIGLPANYGSLSPAEQLLVITDLERVDRGLAPIAGLTSTLDTYAQAGAVANTDPQGPPGATWGSNWAGGEPTVLSSVYAWMYQDGPGSINRQCPPSCWGHRQVLLGAGNAMGAAMVGSGAGASTALLLVSGWTEPLSFSWAQELPYLAPVLSTSGLSVATTPGTSNTTTLSVAASGRSEALAASVAGVRAQWSVSPATCTAPAGGACAFTVSFAPTTAGNYAARLVVQAPDGIHTVAVSGTSGHGYWEVASDGGVFAFGGGGFHGSTGGWHLNAPIVAMVSTPSHGGYWLVASDGGIFAFGDAGFYGSHGGSHLNAPIVAIAATPDGRGYWLMSADGGVFTYGDAGFYGSHGGSHLNAPIVGAASTRSGQGYWLVAADGGVFTYGDAGFAGSEGGQHLNAPIAGMAADPTTGGYWLAATDGGVFNFAAPFLGSEGGQGLSAPIVGIALAPETGGYRLVARDGGIFNFGAPFLGSAGGMALNQPVVGLSSS